MATPFDQINFGSQPNVSNDDIVRVLTDLTPSPFKGTSAGKEVQGGTDAGIARVNSGDSGAFAYKDKNGRAVLTNMAIDSTGKEKPIAALLRSPETPDTSKGAPTFAQGTDTRLQLFEGIKKLTATTDINEARALYNSIAQSLAEEQTRLETEAYRFAEAKFGLPEMLKQIEQNRMLDKTADDYIPGMGDSQITQRIVDQTRELSGAARLEAESFLKRNLGYNSLKTLAVNADREFKRIEANADRTQRIADSRTDRQEAFEANQKFQQQVRKEDREFRRQEEAQQTYNQLSATQIARITMLNAGEIAGLDTDEAKQRKIADLVIGKSKDKKWTEAVSAETKEQLLDFALQGNGVAKDLVIKEESARTGQSIEAVTEKYKKWASKLYDPKMVEETLARKKLDKNGKESIRSSLAGAQFTSDPNKKLEANQQRLTLLREAMQYEIQKTFLEDASTWGSVDPILIKAIGLAKERAGKADIQNVFAAYMSETTGDQRRQRLADFKKVVENAALKQKDSVFGMPNWREAEKLMVMSAVQNGMFAMANNVKQFADKASTIVPPNFGPFGMMTLGSSLGAASAAGTNPEKRNMDDVIDMMQQPVGLR